MRTLSTIAFVCLFVLLAVSSGAPRPARAFLWTDLFLDCASVYAGDAHECEYNYPPGTQRNQCLDTAQTRNTECLSPMYYPTHEPDYCDAARANAAACTSLFSGLDSSMLVMECRMSSGIHLCE